MKFLQPSLVKLRESAEDFYREGKPTSKKRNPIGWKHVCQPKKEGGLGLRRIKDWNQASLSKLCFQMVSDTSSLWVSYFKWKYLKNSNFWKAKYPAKSSWAWRGIIKARDRMKPFVSYEIGNGKKTNLWYDPWLPRGSLVDQTELDGVGGSDSFL